MASQHKLLKAKARRKDYEKKRNILRNKKNNRFIVLTAGGGTLPKSRKYKPSKKNTKPVK
jgi:hypothetical protein